MHKVEIRLNYCDLREEMNGMRVWLDERRFEPSAFGTHENGGNVIFSVSFKLVEEAEAFASRFSGRLTGPRQTDGRLSDVLSDPADQLRTIA